MRITVLIACDLLFESHQHWNTQSIVYRRQIIYSMIIIMNKMKISSLSDFFHLTTGPPRSTQSLKLPL